MQGSRGRARGHTMAVTWPGHHVNARRRRCIAAALGAAPAMATKHLPALRRRASDLAFNN